MPSPEFEALFQTTLAQRTDAPPNLEELRAAGPMLAQFIPPPEGTEIVEVDAGGIPGEWVSAPGAGTDRVVFFLHGGGYCIWSPLPYRNFNRRLADAVGARVLAIDYRLAPEHPHPACIEDAVTAYRWLLAQGVPPERVAITGDSAGGGLTIATLLALRDAGDPLPACAVPISPWIDVELRGEMSEDARAVDVLRIDQLKLFAASYLNGADPRTPLANPLYADLTGLPPTFVIVGEREILLDDAKRFAQRAKQAGVDATLDVEPGMTHIWHMFGGVYPEAQEAVETIAAFMKKYL